VTLQARLALLYLLIGAPTLLISSVTVYLISKERIYEGVDESLMARVQSIEASLVQRAAPLTPAEVESSRRALDRQVADGAVFQIRSADGTVLFSSAGGDVPLSNSEGGTPEAGFSSRAFVAERTRILIAPVVQLGETIGYVEARTPLTLADASVADVRGTLVAGNLVILFLTALPAYVVAGKAIGPVRTVSRLAREIVRTGDFARRLPESASALETKELITAFNEMVERVDRMIGAQKAFLADSSHELRRPLTILRTNLDVLSDPNLKPADRKAVEREMRVEVEAMSRLLSELLLLSREEEQAFSFDELDLSSLCEASLTTARATHRRRSFLAEVEEGAELVARVAAVDDHVLAARRPDVDSVPQADVEEVHIEEPLSRGNRGQRRRGGWAAGRCRCLSCFLSWGAARRSRRGSLSRRRRECLPLRSRSGRLAIIAAARDGTEKDQQSEDGPAEAGCESPLRARGRPAPVGAKPVHCEQLTPLVA